MERINVVGTSCSGKTTLARAIAGRLGLPYTELDALFWGPRWGWGHHHGSWGRHWENGVPPMFEEWHKRAHGQPEEKKE